MSHCSENVSPAFDQTLMKSDYVGGEVGLCAVCAFDHGGQTRAAELGAAQHLFFEMRLERGNIFIFEGNACQFERGKFVSLRRFLLRNQCHDSCHNCIAQIFVATVQQRNFQHQKVIFGTLYNFSQTLNF